MCVTISQQIAKAVTDLTAHDLLKQKFPSRPSERMHMVGIIKANFETIHDIIMWADAYGEQLIIIRVIFGNKIRSQYNVMPT